jgi:hypothetical protein
MADDQTSQQTRVLLVNGQTIILQGDAGDNSINEINADLLQQALQEVSTTTEDAVEETNDEYSAPIPETEDANDNLVAIFQGDQGETHTIQLTVEQAEALGLHFSVDSDDKTIQPDIPENAAENNLYISDEPNTQMVYSEEAKQNSDEVMFENEMDTNTSCADIVQGSRSIDNGQMLESSEEGMGVLSSTVGSLISDQNQPITLIPQFVDGQMTYTVKIQEDQDEGSMLHNRQFTNVDSELKSGPSTVSLQQTNVGVTLSNISSFSTTPLPSVSCSASTTAPISTVKSSPLSASCVQQSVSLPISSVSLPVSSVQQPVTEPLSSVEQPVSSVQQTVSLSNYQCSRTSGSNMSTEKQTKVSYVILPGINTSTSSSVTTKLSNTPLGRLSSSFVSSSRNQSLVNPNNLISTTLKSATTLPVVLSTTNSAVPGQVVAGTNSNLTAIPIVSSNTNVISSTSILAPVATSTSAGGGMIRVVAGGTTNRTLQPILNNNTNKFTSILAPSSGRLIATTSNVTPAPKIVSINPSSVSKTPTTATPEVSNMVSAALTRMPVPNFNSTKPLGSSENPIQLVQHGQTFHR